ncbi:aldehyde dehydrogenase [Streptomyces solisilvae]|uniref:aldehyde dehydrogenase n=1 Tax=Streptomyces malaysiensis TaxID=92644 RepID=UPI0036B4B1CD
MINEDRILIGGQWRQPISVEQLDVVSPATEEVIGRVRNAGADDVNVAATTARRAFDEGTWRRMSVGDRADILAHALDLLEPKLDEIGRLVTAEMGLPVSMAGMVIPAALSAGRYFLDIARQEPTAEIRRGQASAAVLREPVGVVAAIAPWNGPFNSVISKIVPALVIGCSVVYKSAPETPLDAFYVAEALVEAGVPDGVFSYLTGGVQCGRSLVGHPAVDKVSFTGSTATGREIGAECGRSFKRMQLELGGKSAAIVLDDADLAVTIQGLAIGSFVNTGQICAAYSRVLVPRSRGDEVTDALVAAAESLVVGDPFDPATTTGPLVSRRHRERVERYVRAGVNEGAKILTGGGRPEGLEKGWYVQPTVFGSASNSMRICREEIFGPVVAVLTYDSVDEAIAIANDSDYGLHGAVFTTDPEAALVVASAVRTGTFSVNSYSYNVEAPFGGVKSSGVGRDTGREGLTSYYELKTVNIDASMEPAIARIVADGAA